MADRLAIEGVLGPEGVAALEGLGPLELVAAVIAPGPVRSLPAVIEAAGAGLARGFPGRKAAVLVAGGGGEGRPSGADPVPVVQIPPAGPWLRGRAVLAGVAAGRHLGARATAIVDAGLASFVPEWLDRLLAPVVDGTADYVTPAYARAPTEGTLTSNLLAPLCRAVYGRRLHEVLGGCLALSAGFAEKLPPAEDWTDELDGHGAEMRLLVEALTGAHAVVEVPLGPKQLDPGTATTDLSRTLADAVGALFRTMERYTLAWQDLLGSAPVLRRGAPPDSRPAGGEVRRDRMVRAFHLGLKDLLPVWEQVMPDDTLRQLYPLGLLEPDEFSFPAPLWARVACDFAVAYHERRLPRDHLLRALTPLYLGRVAAFVSEVQAGPPARVAEALEQVGRAFEAEKPSLSARWR